MKNVGDSVKLKNGRCGVIEDYDDKFYYVKDDNSNVVKVKRDSKPIFGYRIYIGNRDKDYAFEVGFKSVVEALESAKKDFKLALTEFRTDPNQLVCKLYKITNGESESFRTLKSLHEIESMINDFKTNTVEDSTNEGVEEGEDKDKDEDDHPVKDFFHARDNFKINEMIDSAYGKDGYAIYNVEIYSDENNFITVDYVLDVVGEPDIDYDYNEATYVPSMYGKGMVLYEPSGYSIEKVDARGCFELERYDYFNNGDEITLDDLVEILNANHFECTADDVTYELEEFMEKVEKRAESDYEDYVFQNPEDFRLELDGPDY